MQTFSLIPSTLAWLTVALVRALPTGLGFTILGKRSIPQSDMISISIKQGDTTTSHSLFKHSNFHLNPISSCISICPLNVIAASIKSSPRGFDTTLQGMPMLRSSRNFYSPPLSILPISVHRGVGSPAEGWAKIDSTSSPLLLPGGWDAESPNSLTTYLAFLVTSPHPEDTRGLIIESPH